MEPVSVGKWFVSPRDFAIALLTARVSHVEPSRYVAVRTEVTGLRKDKKLRQIRQLVAGPCPRIGVRNGTALLTGIAASITAQLILGGEIERTGVMAPETCVPASRFIRELARRGINVTKEEVQP